MTIGIYSLYWEEQDLVYIGQSVDIEKRTRQHINMLKSNTHKNHKIQNTYDNYGLPKLSILEKCVVDRLNDLEIYWVNEFNSISKGLNIAEPGSSSYGINHGGAIYSKIQVLLAFRKLQNPNNSVINIAKEINTSNNFVYNLLGGSHIWLAQKYPKLYKRMLDSKQKRISISNKVAAISRCKTRSFISPEGIIYEVTNMKEFCQLHGLDRSHFSSVATGKRPTHKGWKLYLNN